MSSRTLAGLRGAALIATWALCASAQQPDRLAIMRKSVDISRARADTVRALVALDSIRLAHLPVFRTYAGMTVNADSAHVPQTFVAALDSAAARAQRNARAVIGAAADSMLTGVYATITVDSVSPADSRADLVALHVHGNVHPRYSSLNARHPGVPELTAIITTWFEEAAGRRLPPTIARWSQRVFAIGVQPAWVYGDAYRGLTLNHPDLWRSCTGGLRSACRTALAIVPNDDTVSAWYTIARQRTYVAAWYKHRSYWSATYSLQRECVELNSDAACHRLFEQSPPGNGSPTSAWARRALLRGAVMRGGPGAFERLTSATSTDIATLLELTARVPVDTLMDEWRAAVVAARPVPPTPSRVEVASCLVLGILAMGMAVRRRP